MTSNANQLKEVDAVLRNDLSSFFHRVFLTVSPGDTYLHNWHIDAIAYVLMECMQGNINRLVITMPPRYMKSICASVALPAFLLGHDPAVKIVCVSYAQGLALKHAADSQMVMEADWYRRIFPHASMSLKRNTQSELVTQQNGSRLATSVGGTLTGRGGNWLIIDDPQKADEGNSESQRERVIGWFQQAATTRLDHKDKGVIIIIQQRLHQADLAGTQLEKGHWRHLNLAAIAEEDADIQIGPNEFIHRKCDDVLHPERHSLEDLKQLRLEMGEYAFAAQYQQRPSPLGGGLVKWSWFRTYQTLKHPMHAEHIVQSWDTATTANEHSSWTVCTTWYAMEGNLYLVDIHRAKYEFPQLKGKIFELAQKYQATDVIIESGGAGQALVQQIHHEIQQMGQKPFELSWSKPTLDKATRLMAETSEIEAGRVYLPPKAEWLDEFRRELLNFPNGVHDDQVDSLTLFLNWDRARYRYKYRDPAELA